MLKPFAAAAIAALTFGATASAAAPDSAAVKQTVRSFLAKTNAGDDAGALALCADAGSVVDEFAPFHWAQFGTWGTDSDGYYSANKITDNKVTLVRFTHVNVDGARAYVVATVKDFADGKTAPGGPPTAITDEFAPYSWQGADAAQGWFAGLQKSNSEDHDSDLVITPQAPTQLSVNGDRAYGTFPTVLTFKHKGKPTRELGSFAVAFEKSDGNWRIVSWAWATR